MKKNNTMIHSMRSFLAVFLLALMPLTASAVLIDFEQSSGYSTTGGNSWNNSYPANLAAQGDTTKWDAYTGADGRVNFLVAQDSANLNNQLIITNKATTAAYYNYTFSSNELGATFNKTSSVFEYSFRIRYDETTETASNGVLRFGIGGATNADNLFRVELLSDGRINFNYANTYTKIKTTTGGSTEFKATAGQWITFSGTMDYSTGKFTLSANGVEQSVGGSTLIAFYQHSNATEAAYNTPMVSLNGTGFNDNWVQVSIDNISFSAVAIPEPHNVGLLIGSSIIATIAIRFLRKSHP